jgi:hypothetical protein
LFPISTDPGQTLGAFGRSAAMDPKGQVTAPERTFMEAVSLKFKRSHKLRFQIEPGRNKA